MNLWNSEHRPSAAELREQAKGAGRRVAKGRRQLSSVVFDGGMIAPRFWRSPGTKISSATRTTRIGRSYLPIGRCLTSRSSRARLRPWYLARTCTT